MQLTYADTAVERLCTTQELLERAFSDLWALVKLCLSLLEVVKTLADLATFAAVTIQRLRQVSEAAADYLISLGGIQLTVQVLSRTSSVGGPTHERVDLATVQAVSVVSVSQVSAAVAGA
jgi:hypothetical protein